MKINALSYVLALIFLASGGAKLVGLDFELAAFERWGYPLWFMYLTGLLEVLGGAALFFKSLKKLAAPALAGLMIGAIGTHLINQEWSMLIIALAIFSGCVVLTRFYWIKSATA